MKVRGWLLVLVAVVGGGVMLSGSSIWAGPAQHAQFDAEKSELLAALRAVDDRLVQLDAAPAGSGTLPHSSISAVAAATADSSTMSTAGPVESVAGPEQLRARAAHIFECIDSLERSDEATWRGALPGLRSAIAHLEHRTDLAELSAIDSIDELDAHIEAWLSETGAQITNVTQPGSAIAYDRDALDEARVMHARIAERFAALRVHRAQGDVALRRALAQELAGLRRSVRAMVRSTRPLPADTPT
jgi:hypothetical protein